MHYTDKLVEKVEGKVYEVLNSQHYFLVILENGVNYVASIEGVHPYFKGVLSKVDTNEVDSLELKLINSYEKISIYSTEEGWIIFGNGLDCCSINTVVNDFGYRNAYIDIFINNCTWKEVYTLNEVEPTIDIREEYMNHFLEEDLKSKLPIT